MQPTQVIISIGNLHCSTCVDATLSILQPVTSIHDIRIDLKSQTLSFGINAVSKSDDAIKEIRHVVRLLSSEGGFDVDHVVDKTKAHDTGIALSEGWAGLFDYRGIKQRKEAERSQGERLKLHLKRCGACRERIGPVGAETRGWPDPSQLMAPVIVDETSGQEDSAAMATTLSIGGITCASCVNSINSALIQISDVIDVTVNLLGCSGVIRHKPTLSAVDVARLVEDVGFEAHIVSSSIVSQAIRIQSTYLIQGMTCTSCSTSIERRLREIDSVYNVSIDVLSHTGIVSHLASFAPSSILEIIQEVGYEAELVDSHPVEDSNDVSIVASNKRLVTILIDGIFCDRCITRINQHLGSLPLLSFTPVTRSRHYTTVDYMPHDPLDIRQIMQSLNDLAPEFSCHVSRAINLSERGQRLLKREFTVLAIHAIVALVFSVPTFVIAIVGMILLPGMNTFRMELMRPVWGNANLGTVVLWPLATAVQFGVGRFRLFYQRALLGFRHFLRRALSSVFTTRKEPTFAGTLTWKSFFSFGSMDLLVVLSTTISYFASVAMLIIDVRSKSKRESIGTYFDASVFLLMFILLGRTLESYAKSRTRDSIAVLGQLRPETALLVQSSATFYQVEGGVQSKPDLLRQSPSSRAIPIELLEIGDLVLVPPGSPPPTDLTIVSGKTNLDESSLSGESKPVIRGPGEKVYSGTINQSSPIIGRVEQLGAATLLEQIIAAVSDASTRKAPVEKLAERLTGVFVPIIVYLAIIVLLVWISIAETGHLSQNGNNPTFKAIEFAIATLVVACPCGIGLAVPCANAVGVGLAAAEGILAVGGGEAFVAGRNVGIVVMDKTGTITEGKSKLTDKVIMEGSERFLPVIREVERSSTHPLAQGLVEYLDTLPLPEVTFNVIDVRELPGRGLLVNYETNGVGYLLAIGNATLMIENGVTIRETSASRIQEWSDAAKSIVLVASLQHSSNAIHTPHLLAMFALIDSPRASSTEVISALQDRGIRVIMCSGDNEATAKAVAEIVGIDADDVLGAISPQGKAEKIRALQEELAVSSRNVKSRWWQKRPADKVLFLGDGINDAVGLAAADVAVAMGHGSQSALAGADFVLLNSDLNHLLSLLSLSRKVTTRQMLNLGWALSFNAVCIPFAAGVFYPAGGIRLTPVWSAVLMALSSVSVVGSSLAMRWGM